MCQAVACTGDDVDAADPSKPSSPAKKYSKSFRFGVFFGYFFIFYSQKVISGLKFDHNRDQNAALKPLKTLGKSALDFFAFYAFLYCATLL